MCSPRLKRTWLPTRVRRAHLEGEVRRREHVARQLLGAAVAYHQLDHRSLLELQQPVQAEGARHRVEAVVVLKLASGKVMEERAHPPLWL